MIVCVRLWVSVLLRAQAHTPVTCRGKAVTVTSVALCRQSGPKLLLVTDTVRAELDRSNFNQVDFGLCQRCDRAAEMFRVD